MQGNSIYTADSIQFTIVPVPIKPITMCLLCAMLSGCSQEPSEEAVLHLAALRGGTWLRSDFDIVGREVREYSDHSGTYIVLTIKHGTKRITAECSSTWTTETGEEFPPTPVPYDKCSNLPMGTVKLERTDWDTLYYFSASGKHREEIVLTVKKIEIQ
jgi:hypothetical protein